MIGLDDDGGALPPRGGGRGRGSRWRGKGCCKDAVLRWLLLHASLTHHPSACLLCWPRQPDPPQCLPACLPEPHLRLPACAAQLIRANKAAEAGAGEKEEEAGGGGPAAPAVQMDAEEVALVAQGAAAGAAPEGAAAPAAAAASGAAAAAAAPAASKEEEQEDMDMEMSEEEEEEEEAPVRVVKNYRRPDPRQQAVDTTKCASCIIFFLFVSPGCDPATAPVWWGGRSWGVAAGWRRQRQMPPLLPSGPHPTSPHPSSCCRFMVSPITGELVPTEEMAEHMRISLIDPRWREQREIMLSKIRETTKGGWLRAGRGWRGGLCGGGGTRGRSLPVHLL